MVTWGRAFRAAGAYVVFSIVWIIIGGVIISLSYVPIMMAAMMGTPGAEVVGAIVGMIIGYVVILLGVMAAFFKILPEVVAEEVKNRG